MHLWFEFKAMLNGSIRSLVLVRCKQDILRVMLLLNYFINTNFEKVVRLVYCKLSHAMILLIYSQSLYLLSYLTNVLKLVVYVDLKDLQGPDGELLLTNLVLYIILYSFLYMSFTIKISHNIFYWGNVSQEYVCFFIFPTSGFQ
jgi:hypothetical protein